MPRAKKPIAEKPEKQPAARPVRREYQPGDKVSFHIICPMCGMSHAMPKQKPYFRTGSVREGNLIQLRDGRGGQGVGFPKLADVSMTYVMRQKDPEWAALVKDLRRRALEIVKATQK